MQDAQLYIMLHSQSISIWTRVRYAMLGRFNIHLGVYDTSYSLQVKIRNWTRMVRRTPSKFKTYTGRVWYVVLSDYLFIWTFMVGHTQRLLI